ncbi:MAG: type II secretion system F family protein [bacterium]
MPFFIYQAKTKDGKLVSDRIEADNIKLVSNKLQELGYFPLSISLYKRTEKHSFLKQVKAPFQRIRGSDIAVFNRQLADLLKGGLTLLRSLNLLLNQTENEILRAVIEQLKNDVKEGSTFSAALAKHPKVFSRFYIGMVKAGESGGMIEEVMERLADFSEKERDLITKVKSALIYPITMLFIGIGSIIFLMTFVIPKFVIMFADIGQTLPWPTRVLISVSGFLKGYWWLYLPLLVLAIVGLRQYIKTEEGRLRYDRIRLRLPVLGDIFRKETIARFTRTLGVLVANGIVIMNALDIIKQTLNNQLFSEEIDDIYTSVKEGKGLILPFRESNLFPPMVADIIAVGEEAGTLESSLFWIADVYSREVEAKLKALTSLVEPLIILVMGLMVGFVVLAMLLPIFSISDLIK